MSNENKKTAQIIDPGLGELDKVRNILFGREAKANEDRFQTLENTLKQMLDDLDQKLDSRLNDLEQQLNEKESRLQSLYEDAETSNGQNFSDVRKDLDNIAAAFGTDLAQAKAELRSALESGNSQLADDKTDRKALAMMFDEMSMRLRGENS